MDDDGDRAPYLTLLKWSFAKVRVRHSPPLEEKVNVLIDT